MIHDSIHIRGEYSHFKYEYEYIILDELNNE
jgi:hypothetical protein